jgi:hypothetical protein
MTGPGADDAVCFLAAASGPALQRLAAGSAGAAPPAAPVRNRRGSIFGGRGASVIGDLTRLPLTMGNLGHEGQQVPPPTPMPQQAPPPTPMPQQAQQRMQPESPFFGALYSSATPRNGKAVSEGGTAAAVAGSASSVAAAAAPGTSTGGSREATLLVDNDKEQQLAEACELLLLQRCCRDLLLEEFVTTLHLVRCCSIRRPAQAGAHVSCQVLFG